MSLEKVAQYSIPSNHLITIQLMRETDNVNKIKPEYFFFVGLIPGKIDDSKKRTYDFKSAINVKYAAHELAGLYKAIELYVNGKGELVNYSKFSSSATGKKVISLAITSKEQPTKTGSLTIRNVQFRVTLNGDTQSVNFTIEQALSFAEVLKEFSRRSIQLESYRQINNSNLQSPSPVVQTPSVPDVSGGVFDDDPTSW